MAHRRQGGEETTGTDVSERLIFLAAHCAIVRSLLILGQGFFRRSLNRCRRSDTTCPPSMLLLAVCMNSRLCLRDVRPYY
ncbi:hypothetical protein SCLCIDRAFT_1224991 [Scleroderma citrinum Foug A]|uniref:Uncharacterized protein n=1 Tax=Scleroderma citrinum Foug A TaxID=1036808 RepID=A0A0C2YMC4_9AGAM|nr:hypothetical protein SCLCIDRAFT_1224991 [Scleroderma citrinum Foug A]